VPVETPVVLFLFNRPEKVRRVLDVLRRVEPRRLFVVADGPRPGHVTDPDRCAQARAIVDVIDWPCEVSQIFSPTNLGVKARIESGLDAVFADVGEAIVVEDDCLPHPSFFKYAEELLDRYRPVERVMTISGTRPALLETDGPESYVFSQYSLTWGWATWRRAWARYDGQMRDWPARRDSDWLQARLGNDDDSRYWSYIFETNYEAGLAGHWDYAWLFSSWQHDALAIHPRVNLVTNIGFDAEATHTTTMNRDIADLPAGDLPFPLAHPGVVEPNAAADRALSQLMFGGSLRRVFDRLNRARRQGQRSGLGQS
jgi:hypothetical protein